MLSRCLAFCYFSFWLSRAYSWRGCSSLRTTCSTPTIVCCCPCWDSFFLPLTTLTYAWMMNSHRPLEGTNLLILVIAAVIDVSGLGGGEWHRRSRY